ncbi:hypothetical protein TH61_04125 [Rufibacter sp. DG15C]|uniref:hypothetical protein n=1 Tax=Rufibacter sp. DG15C TaxID=1379909 RepID=UPI00078B88F6|nr:hypothetical protein [Rufibacter sp. DG15C]AMM50522.1 hypothetical protein TH61_04125 [Rufibacter sp. DG15C]
MRKITIIPFLCIWAIQGCTSVNPIEKVKQDLQGNWNGVFIEEFEIRPSLIQKASEDLEQSLARKRFKNSSDSVRLVFDEAQLKMYKGQTHLYSLDNLSILAEGKEIEVTNTVEPNQKLSFIIEKLTPDSLILKDNNNSMYLNGGDNPADPDTIAVQQYYSLRKTK